MNPPEQAAAEPQEIRTLDGKSYLWPRPSPAEEEDELTPEQIDALAEAIVAGAMGEQVPADDAEPKAPPAPPPPEPIKGLHDVDGRVQVRHHLPPDEMIDRVDDSDAATHPIAYEAVQTLKVSEAEAERAIEAVKMRVNRDHNLSPIGRQGPYAEASAEQAKRCEHGKTETQRRRQEVRAEAKQITDSPLIPAANEGEEWLDGTYLEKAERALAGLKGAERTERAVELARANPRLRLAFKRVDPFLMPAGLGEAFQQALRESDKPKLTHAEEQRLRALAQTDQVLSAVEKRYARLAASYRTTSTHEALAKRGLVNKARVKAMSEEQKAMFISKHGLEAFEKLLAAEYRPR